ncbi:MAG TPA: DUF427 domain-containing protein [Solirubrobacteraceae bacterium]|nr:DUF427 domain-containing protein [Solirubrobacteraceae bacterium]
MENVWDYPRPPRVERCTRRVRVQLEGVILVDTRDALRVLETSHPPTIYVALAEVAEGVLVSSAHAPSLCEFKGRAIYLDAIVGGQLHEAVAWTYPQPAPGYEMLGDRVSFYPGRVRAWLDDEPVAAQPGDFYGGWITGDLKGPFKGAPGTLGW